MSTTPTTSTVTSPGSYYHRHIKPNPSTNSHIPLDGTTSPTLPTTAKRITAPSSWLVATEYEHVDLTTGVIYPSRHLTRTTTPILTVWMNNGSGMRIANVDSHHVGALHAGNIPHPVTKRQLTTPTPIREAKARTWAQAERIKEQRAARRRRGIVDW